MSSGDTTNIEDLLELLILLHIDLEQVILLLSYLLIFFLLLLLVTPEEDSGFTGEKQIADLLTQMEKYKSVNCFSPVPPESSSESTWAQDQLPSH